MLKTSRTVKTEMGKSMTNKLAENIRTLRKQRSLTQEQLAEVLGVTTGAVYKWEAKLSQPELNMVMEIADFFDTSVDVLLGYEMRDNHIAKSVQRLKDYRHEKNREGLTEAEKSLKKYPNNFDVVYNSALLYMVLGIEAHDKLFLNRALELFENSRILISQNTDPKINESVICGSIAEILLSLGESDKAIDILRENNAGGLYDDLIGLIMATEKRYEKNAQEYLTDALLGHVVSLIRTIMGYLNIFYNQKDYESAKAILKWGIQVISGLKNADKISFFDKMECVFLAYISWVQKCLGEAEEAKKSLLRAKNIADKFDACPNYDMSRIKFVKLKEKANAYDDIGTTAMMGIEATLAAINDEELLKLWRGIVENEKEEY